MGSRRLVGTPYRHPLWTVRPRSLLALTGIALVLAIAIACRGGAGTGSEVSVPFLTPTVVPIQCQNADYPEDAPQIGDDTAVRYSLTESGLRVFDRQEGDGEMPPDGSTVTVHYTGFLEDGCVIDTTRISGQARDLVLGLMINGMNEGIATMRVGGVRRLRIPAALAYGAREIPGVIPANATLIFEIELVDFRIPGEQSATSTAERDG